MRKPLLQCPKCGGLNLTVVAEVACKVVDHIGRGRAYLEKAADLPGVGELPDGATIVCDHTLCEHVGTVREFRPARVRWRALDRNPSIQVTSSEVDDFLEDILLVCNKHGLALSHEDCHGGFVVEDWKAMEQRGIMGSYASWVRDASIGTTSVVPFHPAPEEKESDD